MYMHAGLSSRLHKSTDLYSLRGPDWGQYMSLHKSSRLTCPASYTALSLALFRSLLMKRERNQECAAVLGRTAAPPWLVARDTESGGGRWAVMGLSNVSTPATPCTTPRMSPLITPWDTARPWGTGALAGSASEACMSKACIVVKSVGVQEASRVWVWFKRLECGCASSV